jgi:membrane fusion protein (multidrug efflux system)
MKTNVFQKAMIFQLLIVVAIAAGCSAPAENKEPSQSIQQAHTETFVLTKGGLVSNLKIPAELIAYKQVDLYAKVNSYVKTLSADVGSTVKAGQLLATLEAPELISQLAASESKYKSQEAIYESSNATYQRILETSQTPGTISKNDVEIALAKRNSDYAQLQAAKADYHSNSTITQYLSIHAPFDGIISARNVNQGAYTGPSGKGSDVPIFTLQELTHLRLVISVPEAYKSYIKLNDVVKFTVKAYPDQEFSAKIARRSGVMDSQLRAEHIELDVINNDLKLSPGMVAEASISLTNNGGSAFVVPKSAVLNSAEGVFMIQALNGKAVKLAVHKGRETDSLTEVSGAVLQDGSTYVKKASEEIRDGSSLK